MCYIIVSLFTSNFLSVYCIYHINLCGTGTLFCAIKFTISSIDGCVGMDFGF